MHKSTFTPTTVLKRLLSPYVIIGSIVALVLLFLWLVSSSPPNTAPAVVVPPASANSRKSNSFVSSEPTDPNVPLDPNDDDDDDETPEIEPPETTDDIVFEYQTTSPSPRLKTDPLSPLPGEKLSSRWIVVTSIQQPTDDVKLLGGLSKFGWRVLVVGDKSTPSDWKAPDGVRFLSFQEANTLGYNLLSYQRWKTYSIKNIGYLFAIQHGAKLIYDTDDDNHPIDDLKSMLKLAGYSHEGGNDDAPVTQTRALLWKPSLGDYSLPAINSLPHFGQSTLWPRGFPLSEVARPPPRRYQICTTRPPSWIQGVVNGDPDMDAIFRLTRKHYSTPINLTFDHAPAVIAPEKFFVQSNSQNTLFSQKALALLFFPFSQNISMRETDIWRAYIGQPLLWLVGGRKGYVFPNAFQARNPHDYLKDFADELNLYKLSGQLISFLSSWTCPAKLEFSDCIIRLYEDLSMKQLIAAPFDVSSVTAWIADLRRMDYSFAKREQVEDCQKAEGSGGAKDQRFVQFYPVEQPVPLPAHSSLNKIAPISSQFGGDGSIINSGNCSAQLSSQIAPSSSAALVISLSAYPADSPVSLATALDRFDALYKPYFERRIFCLDSAAVSNGDVILSANRARLTIVEAIGNQNYPSESFAVDCLKQISNMRFDVRAFVYLSLDRQRALLTPNGVEKAVAFGSENVDGNDFLVGACGSNDAGPSIFIAHSTSVEKDTFDVDTLRGLCKSDPNEAKSVLTSSNCYQPDKLSPIVANCTSITDEISANWLLPFCPRPTPAAQFL